MSTQGNQEYISTNQVDSQALADPGDSGGPGPPLTIGFEARILSILGPV